MGLFDRIAQRVAAEITKAPVTFQIPESQLQGIALQQQYGASRPMERNPLMANVPFAPGFPLIPGAINPVNPATGRAEPRRYEFQVAQNINVTETRPVSFKVLRSAADQIDILRRCLEVIKSKITALDWDIVLAQDAQEKIASEAGRDYVRAMAKARDSLIPEINRLRMFWENPDRANGLTWIEWLNMSLEDILVLDAWAVWPQSTVKGDLYGFQILDGSTIKPLLDDRGMRPMPPNPAFQQILYGFPRTEFTANDDDPSADGEFTSDDLAYMVRNRRTTSVYGYGPVERALPLADLYLRRQQWIRAEYTDGVVPELFFESDLNVGGNPDLIRGYENILNDDLSGQTEQRHRARILPAGIGKPWQPAGYEERFRSEIDDFLISSICGHFGVQPTEIGYTPRHGLGGKGFEEGKAESAEQLGALPLAQWVSRMITNLSYTYLGMPRELEFKIMESSRRDTLDAARRQQVEVQSGKTMNERRSDDGLPLLDTPEADMPILVAGTTAYVFTPDGLVAAGSPTTDDQMASQLASQPVATPVGEKEIAQAQKGEMRAFLRRMRKNENIPFKFEYVPDTYADALNKMVASGDREGARWFAEWWLDS